MTNKDYDNEDLGDGFEPTWRKDEPLFSYGWAEVIGLGGLMLFAIIIILALT